MPPQTVFIADDVDALRVLLRTMLEEGDDIVVVGEASDGPGAIAGVIRTRPDVLLLDLAMPGMDGLEALAALRNAAPSTQVIVVSGFKAERMKEPALANGAVEYFEKGRPLSLLRETIRGLAGPAPAFQG